MPKGHMPVDDVSKLSPDGFSRFFMLVDILVQIYGNNKRPIRILDVGGGSEFFEHQLKKASLRYDLTALDIIPKPSNMTATYIQGDATNMDLADNSYDVVVSTDVMEHIPTAKKQAFADECLRVASELCIIAAPFDTPGVHAAEVAVNDFNKKLFGSGQDWLEEHLEYGKPTVKLVVKALEKSKISYVHFGTQNINTWLLNTHLNLIEARLGLDTDQHAKINLFYNQNILGMGEYREPTYRHFFVAFKEPSLQKKFSVSKYTEAKQENEKIAQYTSRLLNLVSDKIMDLTDANQALDTKVLVAQQKAEGLKAEINSLQAVVEDQAKTLNTYRPLINVLRKTPLRKAYALINRKK